MRLLGLLLSLIAIVTTSACDGNSSSEGITQDIFVTVGDTLRDARIWIHPDLSADEPVHLLIALHGSGDRGPSFQSGADLDETLPANVIVAYPTAAKGNWAEGCNCNIADRLQIDDLGFMAALIDRIKEDYRISRDRTYALGFSQGGLFAYRLACQMEDEFAAVAAISAPMSVPLSQACNANPPVSVLTVHGRKDSTLPWRGTNNGALSLLSAPSTVVFWKDQYDCGIAEQGTLTSGDAILRTTSYNTCDGGARVHLYEMPEGQHAWYTQSPDVRAVVTGFFGL